jgi:hypothetical protein
MEVGSQLDIPTALLTWKTYALVKKVEEPESRFLLAEDKIPSLLEMEP